MKRPILVLALTLAIAVPATAAKPLELIDAFALFANFLNKEPGSLGPPCVPWEASEGEIQLSVKLSTGPQLKRERILSGDAER